MIYGKNNLKINAILQILSIMFICNIAAGKIIYVDHNAVGLPDGSSWQNAFDDLRDALKNAKAGDEIRVAQGEYTPYPQAVWPIDARLVSFQLINNVTILGGFAGINEQTPDERNIKYYQTILSGDLYGDDMEVNDSNDLKNDPKRSENCYHVVTSSDTNETAVLDGFIIKGGNANELDDFNRGSGIPNLGGFIITGDDSNMCGAGLYNIEGSPTIRNCTFTENYAIKNGGGMYGNNGSPNLFNCIFSVNSAERGGGLYNFQGNLNLTDCNFAENYASDGGGIYSDESNMNLKNCFFYNRAGNRGGGLYNFQGNLALTDCNFTKNYAYDGGGIFSNNSNLNLKNCFFYNRAGSRGGGLYNYLSNLILTGCNFVENYAFSNGGGIYSEGRNMNLNKCKFIGNFTNTYGGGICIDETALGRGTGGTSIGETYITNCIFIGNTAQTGGGLNLTLDSTFYVANCISVWNSAVAGSFIYASAEHGELVNCIAWYSDNSIHLIPSTNIQVKHCDIQGGWPGVDRDGPVNINVNPLFLDPLGPDNIGGTGDEDLRLAMNSPCIDTGDPSYVSVQNETDLDGNPRIVGGRIDMGAYEFQGEIYVDDDAPYDNASPSDSNIVEDGTRNRPFNDIQEAIDIAKDGYKVLVLPGVYSKINFKGKAITVTGTEGAAVIEAVPDWPSASLEQDAVTFYTGEDSNSVLKNFIIRNSGLAISLDYGCSPTIRNITFVDNNFAIAAYEDSNPDIRNCIFWNNKDGDLFGCQAFYSCLKGGTLDKGNFFAYPLFVAYAVNDTNNSFPPYYPIDRFVDETIEDYHLKSEGWRWNENSESWTWDEITSPCIDAGDPCTALGDEPMSIPRDPNNLYGLNLRIDMGAYGGTSQASMPPLGWVPGTTEKTPPFPNPAQWNPFGGNPKENIGRSGIFIAMAAKSATDISGFVEYFFQCTTNSNFSSDWQNSSSYSVFVGQSVLGLRFRVKARDLYKNETEWSEERTAIPLQ